MDVGEDWGCLLGWFPFSFIFVAPDAVACPGHGHFWLPLSGWRSKERTSVITQAPDGQDHRGGWVLARGRRAEGLGPLGEGLGTSLQDCVLLAASTSQPGSALVGRSRSETAGLAGSVQQGAAAVRGWVPPATATPLCTTCTLKRVFGRVGVRPRVSGASRIS